RGPEGAWAPPPPVMVPYSGSAGTPVPVTDSHRVLARVAAGLCFVGFVVGSTSAFMLLAAGIIGLRTKPLTKALGYMATSVGAAGLLVQWMLDGQPFPFTALWATMSLACCLGFLVFSLKPR
ncbi:hypothetical protein ACFQ06_13845, partial [Tessaracoccus lubricantis]